MKTNLLIVCVGLLWMSCTKKASISLPTSQPKLVVTCFISPQDSVIGAVVRMSDPKRGINGSAVLPTEGGIRNASVTISGGGISKTLPFDASEEFYKLRAQEFPIEPGKTYFLQVKTPDGKNTTASTTVPLNALEIDYLKTSIRSESATKLEADVELSVKDITNETNYVGIFFHQVFSPVNSEEPFTVMGYFDSDEKLSKPSFRLVTGTSFYHADSLITAGLNISVLNCSREFYLYNKSIQESGIGALNPFSDPVMVYTNMSDGYGCFGAYNGSFRSVTLR